MGGAESLGTSKGQTQIWHQPAGSMDLQGEGSEKGQWPLLALMPDTSVPPSMSLVPFKLLSQCGSSEGLSLSKSGCGFFKGNCLGLQEFLPPTQFPLIFAARSYGDLSSWHWNPGLGVLVWGEDSLLLRYPSCILFGCKCFIFSIMIFSLPFRLYEHVF